MKLKSTGRMNLVLMAGALISGVMAPVPVHADLKIVSEVSVTRSSPQSQDRKPNDSSPASSQDSSTRGSSLISPHPAQDQETNSSPRTVTTYYRGSEARVEAADGTVTLYDRAADKVYTLHPTDRTYSEAPLKSLLEQASEPAGRRSGNSPMKLESKVDLKEDKEAEKKTFAGKEAIRYSLTGSAAMKRSSAGGFGRRGGFPGGRRFPRGGGFPGGGFPGGGFPGGDRGSRDDSSGGGRGSSRRGMSSMLIEGEYWIAAPFPLPAKTKNPLMPTIAQTVPAGPFQSPLNDKLTRIKGFPVASKVTVTTTTPRSQASTTVTTSMEVKSITDSALDASLFKVPEGYKQVDAPPASTSQRAQDASR